MSQARCQCSTKYVPLQVWQLILLQGVTFGVSGGILYYPVLILFPQWFVRRRGLATGIIFAGAGPDGMATVFCI